MKIKTTRSATLNCHPLSGWYQRDLVSDTFVLNHRHCRHGVVLALSTEQAYAAGTVATPAVSLRILCMRGSVRNMQMH